MNKLFPRIATEQTYWTASGGWYPQPPRQLNAEAQLVLVFGSTELLRDVELFVEIQELYPQAHLFGCSTAGEICGPRVLDHSVTVTALAFAHTRVQTACTSFTNNADGYRLGAKLARALPVQDLTHVIVLSDGLKVNGSELVQGLTSSLPPQVTVTGGLSADGERFQETLVLCDAPAEANLVAAVGLYGKRLKVGYASFGGWDQFGPERLITRSQSNVLYELDSKSALALYKKYLGEHAQELPAAGLLFPLGLRLKGRDELVVRTILGISEETQSLTFAGDVPEGAYARLMKANLDRLIDGAISAAQASCKLLSTPPDWALLISCVGRKLVLKQRVEEEVEGVQEVFGPRTALTGFYSYGEISPFMPAARCELHNQTMTVTTFTEI